MQKDIRKHIEALDEFQKTNRDDIDEDSDVLPYFEEYKSTLMIHLIHLVMHLVIHLVILHGLQR